MTTIKNWLKLIESLITEDNQQTQMLIEDPFEIVHLQSVDPDIWENTQVKKSVIRFMLTNIESDQKKLKIRASLVFGALKRLDCPWPELNVLEAHINLGTAVTVYEDNNVSVIVPKDQEAACHYGLGTDWDTADTYVNQFDNYQKSPIYMLIPKQPKSPNEKYQLHFSSEEFIDRENNPVWLGDLLTQRFPKLIDFFINNPDSETYLKKTVTFAPDAVLELVVKQVWSLAYDEIMNILSNWESNDDYYYTWLKDKGYVDDEGSVDWDQAPSYLEYNDDANDWYTSMERSIKVSPHELRQIVAERIRSNEDTGDNIYRIEEYIAHNVYMHLQQDGYRMDRWISRKLIIRPSATGPVVSVAQNI